MNFSLGSYTANNIQISSSIDPRTTSCLTLQLTITSALFAELQRQSNSICVERWLKEKKNVRGSLGSVAFRSFSFIAQLSSRARYLLGKLWVLMRVYEFPPRFPHSYVLFLSILALVYWHFLPDPPVLIPLLLWNDQ